MDSIHLTFPFEDRNAPSKFQEDPITYYLKGDIHLLLECLDYQKENTSAVKQALVTLSSAVSDSASHDGQDIFRNAGGIHKVLKLVTKSKIDEITEVGLFCLGNAVEKNVYSQKLLSTASFFNFLHAILSTSECVALKKRQMAAFVLLCLVSNNSFGQNIARQSSCLHDILSLIRNTLSKDSDMNTSMTVEVWATLVRAACVCVNNPVNEENQRLCSTLFPYLLSLLGNHTDVRILKPVLSLICLTVSYNAQNQRKLARCGGLPILIRKLKLVLHEKEDTVKQEIGVQLICTLDVCITENEDNSKVFGELGGVRLVLSMLLDQTWNSQDKVQLVLTLAHAVDSYAANKDTISDGNGIKVLIQQMTETSDEELSKTTKYLLHMCVSSETGGICDEENEENKPKMDSFTKKLEEMKRQSDLEILQKLNDLDTKLKGIEHRDTETSRTITETMNSLKKPETFVSNLADLPSQPFPNRSAASVCSSNSVTCQHSCPTPREKTLMAELVKEKQKREKLEQLNHLLQEDVVMSRAALTDTENHRLTYTEHNTVDRNVNPHMYDIPLISQSETGSTSIMSHFKNNQLACKMKEFQGIQDTNKPVFNLIGQEKVVSDRGKFPENFNNDVECFKSAFKPKTSALYAYPVHDTFLCNERGVGKFSNQYGDISEVLNCTNVPVDLTVSNSSGKMHNSVEQTCLDQRKTKINNASSICDINMMRSRQQDLNNCDNIHVNPNTTNKISTGKEERDSKSLNVNNSSVTRRQNAEIQCGTPYVNSDNANTRNTQIDESSQTCFETKTNKQKRQLINTSVGHISITTNRSTSQSPVSKTTSTRDSFRHQNTSTTDTSTSQNTSKRDKSTNKNGTKCTNTITDSKIAKVVLSDILSSVTVQSSHKILKPNSPGKIKTSNENKTSSDTFIKPIAAPPRKKVRVTPLMGSKKVLNKDSARTCKPQQMSFDIFSDLESEFDQQLVRTIKNVNNRSVTETVNVNPSLTYGINYKGKSQNNTTKIDRHLDNIGQNVTQAWRVTPTTPDNQCPIPVRPAFSDCGTRRFNVFESPYSVKSVDCLRKNNLHVEGMNIHPEMKQSSPGNSSLDSDIEGCRSSSDVSDDIKSLNITTTALRSHQKGRNTSDLCPGCSSSLDRQGFPCTSRNYNLTLETNPYTCSFHRHLRTYERCFIRAKKKEVNKRKKKSSRLLDFENICFDQGKPASYNYEPSDSDPNHITPPVLDSCSGMTRYKLVRNRKERRQRVPYTKDEENNVREGVKRLGKHWNQILVTYNFHPSRTNVDLMDKYKRMMASDSGPSEMNSTKPRRCSKPFSLCEERRLRKGVKMFGQNWKAILQAYSFERSRTSEELRNKWRVLQKHLEFQ